jgi:hypothetical protein
MSNENLQPPSIPEMLRVTGLNQAQFMEQVAQHMDKLEADLALAKARIAELEGKQNGTE